MTRSARFGGVVVGTHIYTENKTAGNRDENEVRISHPFPAAQTNTQEKHGAVSALNVTTSNTSIANRTSTHLEGKESDNISLSSKRTDATTRLL